MLENSLPFNLPEDFKLSLLHHDGQNDPAQQLGWLNYNKLLTTEETYEAYTMHCELFDDWEPVAGLKPDKIKNVVWSKQWLKFTEFEGDGYILDMDPAKNGIEGQIFYHRHDDPVSKTLAKSYRGFLSAIAESFQQGHYKIVDSLPMISLR